MSESSLVLDANVLIRFYESDWFNGIGFWDQKYEVVTPEAVWETEFVPRRGIESPPEWLTTARVEERISPSRSGQLSRVDWRVLVLARNRDGMLVTSDKRLKRRAEKEDVTTVWTSNFLLKTFLNCGISTADYRKTVDEFIIESYLPPSVSDKLRTAEKPR